MKKFKKFSSFLSVCLSLSVVLGNFSLPVLAYEKGDLNSKQSENDSLSMVQEKNSSPAENSLIEMGTDKQLMADERGEEIKSIEGSERIEKENKNYVEGEVLVKYRKNKINLETFLGRTAAENFSIARSMEKKEDLRENNISVLRIKDGKTVEEKIAELKNDSNVEYIEPNYKRYPADIATNDPYGGLLWGLDNTGQSVNGVFGANDADIDAPEAWKKSEATILTPVTVAVIDSGVAYNHPDLAANMWDGTNCVGEDKNGISLTGGCNHGYDYEDNDKIPLPTYSSHGTHIAGTIAAIKNNNKGIAGVTSNVKIMAIKYDDTVSNEIRAIDFAINNGAKIINASFGATSFSQSECDAIGRFKDAGGIFVAAAMNGGSDGIGDNNDIAPQYPANCNIDNIISVAATDQNDSLATFSNYGATSVDVGAPGKNIYSTVADSSLLFETFGGVTPPNIPSGWIEGGTNNKWATYDFADSFWGKVLYGHVPSSPYDNNANTTVTSPTYNLGGNTIGATIDFWTKCDTEYTSYYTGQIIYDYMALEYSGDGVNFNEIYRWDEPFLDWLNGDSSDSGGAMYHFKDLPISSNYLTSNFTFRLRWVTDSSLNNYDGCLIDDIKIIKYNDGSDEQYGYMSGTSMAVPHVVGLAALLWGYKSSLTPGEVKNVILNSGDPLSSLNGKTVSGKRINAYNALNAPSQYGSLVITAASDTPDKSIAVMGTNDNEVSKFKLTGTSEAWYIEKFSVVLDDGQGIDSANRDNFSAIKLKYQTQSQYGTSSWTVSSSKTFGSIASLAFNFSGADRIYVPKDDNTYITVLASITDYNGGNGAKSKVPFKMYPISGSTDSFLAYGAQSGQQLYEVAEPASTGFNLHFVARSKPVFAKSAWSGFEVEMSRFTITAVGYDVIFDGTAGTEDDIASACLKFDFIASSTDDATGSLSLYDWNENIVASSGTVTWSSGITSVSFVFEERDVTILAGTTKEFHIDIGVNDVTDFNCTDEYIYSQLRNDDGGDLATGSMGFGQRDIVWHDGTNEEGISGIGDPEARFGMPALIKNIGPLPLTMRTLRGTATCQPDTTAPVITLLGINPVNLYVDEAYTDAGATALDNIDGNITANIVVVNPVNTSAVGTYTVTYNVFDNAGNPAQEITRTVNILPAPDTTPPVITAPADQTFEATGPETTPTLVEATAIDIVDPSPVITYAPHGFSVGTTIVTWTATDASENSSTTTSNVTIQDTTPPAIASHDDVTVEADSSMGAVVNYDLPTATDLVDGSVAVVCAPYSGTVFPLGDTLITCTSTDTHSNPATSNFTVHVVDTTAPIITLPVDINQEANGILSTVDLGTATTTDTTDPNPVIINDAPATFPLGTTIVTWTATDASGNHASATQNVVIVDTILPVVNVNTPASPTKNPSITFTITDETLITIECKVNDGEFASCVSPFEPTFDGGTYTVTVRATDAAGNIGSDVTDSFIVDINSPTINITGPAAISQNTDPSFTFDSPDGGANFECKLDSSEFTSCTSPVLYEGVSEGSHEFVVRATDEAGNIGMKSYNFIVDLTPPTIAIHDDILSVAATDSSGAVVTYTAPDATDAVDGTFSATCSPAPGSTFALGTTLVTCNASDVAGNAATPTSFNVTVEDKTPPVITLTGNATINLAIGQTYTELGATATDNVDGDVASHIIITGSVDTATAGTYYIDYNVSDAAGNNAEQKTRTVIVSALQIASEQKTDASTNSVTIQWTTSHLATSRVLYDTASHPDPITGTVPNYGYANSTTEDITMVTNHSVIVSGLSAATTYYMRPVSHGSPEILGDEITTTTSAQPSGGGGGGGGGGSSYTYSSAKAITAFNFTNIAVIGVINESTHSIVLNVPFGTDVNNLVPTITISSRARVSPNSGVAQNFTNPVIYTVTAENYSTQAYTVRVVVLGVGEVAGAATTRGAKPEDYGLKEGNLIRAEGDFDIFIINQYGYKRLFLNPAIFNMYGHLGSWKDVITVTPAVRDAFITSSHYRYVNEDKVYHLEVSGEDTGTLHWINMTAANFFVRGGVTDAIFTINKSELDWYPKGAEKTSL
ncbi:MAG: S8 family serine peptidase [Candidatus Omnitrophota bacterium]|nr:S8 family serine peptidase [Candidatus Omnitrophota bacterium]